MADKNICEQGNLRMIDPSCAPGEKAVAEWIGTRCFSRWKEIRKYIEQAYPGVFSPEWLYGGKKHGWGLRYKKSKSFCTLIPEKNRLLIVIVLGGKEREETEKIIHELDPGIREIYNTATTYHDGKWLKIDVSSSRIIASLKRLMEIKRKPRPA